MATSFVPVTTAADQEKLAAMAHEIWNEYWPPRIGQAQVDYMVKNFQSLEAIRRDMSEHSYDYWFIFVDDSATSHEKRLVGYTGGHPEPETNRYFISKIYLLQDERGHGIAKDVIRFYDDTAISRGFARTYLTVNKYNDGAIRSYLRNGFEIIDSVETDIGNGFIMDDYIMEHICTR